MKPKNSLRVELFLARSQYLLSAQYFPAIADCVSVLSDEEIWWRANAASNSVGNLMLHLSGNVRQWIISGLGGTPDSRDRDREFDERGPIPCKALVTQLRKNVREACRVIVRLPEDSLTRSYVIQGFHVTGIDTVLHVVEHFSYHTGQIIFLTKMKQGKDLGFTQLPPAKPKKGRAKR